MIQTSAAVLARNEAASLRETADYIRDCHDQGMTVPAIVDSLRRIALEVEIAGTPTPDGPADLEQPAVCGDCGTVVPDTLALARHQRLHYSFAQLLARGCAHCDLGLPCTYHPKNSQ